MSSLIDGNHGKFFIALSITSDWALKIISFKVSLLSITIKTNQNYL